MCVRLISLLAWTVCKLFYSKITQPFRQKSHECALKLTDLWNTSLQLFDLNYKFELVGALLLAWLNLYIRSIIAHLVRYGEKNASPHPISHAPYWCLPQHYTQ